MGCFARGYGARIPADALNHGSKAIGTLLRQMIFEPKFGENLLCVDGEDFIRRLAFVKRKQYGDQALNNQGVTGAAHGKFIASAAARWNAIRNQPHLTGTAAHFCCLCSQVLRQFRKLAPKFDDVAIAILPIVEDAKIRFYAVEVHVAPWIGGLEDAPLTNKT